MPFLFCFQSIRRCCICFLMAIVPQCLSAQAADEFIRFFIKNAGTTVTGRFEQFEKNIHINTQDPTLSVLEGKIQVRSIQTGIGMRDKHLQGSDYFDAKKYPEIIFKSKAIKKINAQTLSVSGDLTIKQTTQPIECEVKLIEKNQKKYATTTLSLNRRNFGVGGNSWLMSDSVQVHIQVAYP